MTRRRFAMASMGALALATTMVPGGSWAASPEERPWPHLRTAPDGMCVYHPATCSRSSWLAFLAGMKLAELTAPPGGRAYRWLWVNMTADPRVGVAVPSIGYVEVVVGPDGTGRLRSPWSDKPVPITAEDIAPFEAALAKTEFATLPEQDQNAANWLDYPPEQLMEAVVDGRYHFVHRVGGISEPGIRDAGVLLEKLARRELHLAAR